MTFVIDASVALAWVLPGEQVAAVEHVIDLMIVQGAIAPSLWRLEIGNVLGMSVRRRRLNSGQRDQMISALRAWPITIDDETDRYAWSVTLGLADRYGLTVYDAAYLELADRKGTALATLDNELISAATAAGVPLIK